MNYIHTGHVILYIEREGMIFQLAAIQLVSTQIGDPQGYFILQ